MPMTTPVAVYILAGGSGERLWPLSRKARPKPFIEVSGKSLLRRTVERYRERPGMAALYVVTGRLLAGAFAAEAGLQDEQVLVEPEAKDTGPAAALATWHAQASHPGAVVLIAPADHYLADEDAWHEAVRRGSELAAGGSALVTFGLKPDRPATEYGYIEVGEEVRPGAFKVNRFTEKPDAGTAEAFLAGGKHLWNSGVFAWTPQAFWAQAERHAPELAEAFAKLPGPGVSDTAALADAFARAPSRSIDYLLMERAEDVVVVPVDCGWDDLGGYLAAERMGLDLSASGARIVELDASGNLVYQRPDGLVALLGVKDLIVVRAGETVLVCPRDRAEELKRLVRHLREKGLERFT
jgi:mannose-1-phosphate guanylyltransferase/mannose-6-phosphate isomerase